MGTDHVRSQTIYTDYDLDAEPMLVAGSAENQESAGCREQDKEKKGKKPGSFGKEPGNPSEGRSQDKQGYVENPIDSSSIGGIDGVEYQGFLEGTNERVRDRVQEHVQAHEKVAADGRSDQEKVGHSHQSQTGNKGHLIRLMIEYGGDEEIECEHYRGTEEGKSRD